MSRLQALRLAGHVAAGDGRSLLRDPLLRWMLLLVPLLALMMRWLVPLVDARVGVDLRAYDVLFLSGFATLAGGMVAGFIVGMMLLDERDDGTLAAILVTPLPFTRYLTLKLVLPTLAGTLLTVACLPLTGLDQWRWGYLPATCAGALWAPVAALLLAAFAANKVQGILLFRVFNVVVVIPMAAWALPRPWAHLFGIFPGYWPLEAFWAAARGDNITLPLAVAVAYPLVLTWFLMRRFHHVARRS